MKPVKVQKRDNVHKHVNIMNGVLTRKYRENDRRDV